MEMLAVRTFLLTLFISFLAEPTQSAITYMAQCNYDDTTGFSSVVVVEKAGTDTIYQIAALTSANALAAGCTVGQVGTSNQYTSTFTLDTTGATVTPAACASAFVVLDSNSDGIADEVTFSFLVQTIDGYVFDTDAVFKYKCTTADHNNVIIETFTITSLPTDNLGLKSVLALEVYDGSDGTLKASGSQLTLGGSYFFKLKHTYANSQNKQIGLYVNKLVFYEGADSTTTPNVIAIDNGCKQVVPAYGLSVNFAKDASSVLPTNGGAAAGGSDGIYITTSGAFEPALWMTTSGISANLKIEAVIVRCIFADQSKCDNPQANVCAAGRRRRRDAEDAGLQNLTSLSTRFTIALSAGRDDQISGTNNIKGSMETCYQTYTFWIVVLIFGILMLLCLIFAVYLFFRLRREKESRKRTEEKYGVLNPAF